MSDRIEKDSLGEVTVPDGALYAAQTQRAVDNFPISGIPMPRQFIKSLGLIKASCAEANLQLALLNNEVAKAIIDAANMVAEGKFDKHFPVDIFQTGSGTSSNMNSNEVISSVAKVHFNKDVHPNDHVNMGQSSNDIIPTAIHVSAAISMHEILMPGLEKLQASLDKKRLAYKNVTKTGRTHLMDAMPITFGQEFSGWHAQITSCIETINASFNKILKLTIGGTAVGTGVNTHPKFSKKTIASLASKSGLKFVSSENFFRSMSSQDDIVELSGSLKMLAVSLMKIANDLRWMNSGPLAGIGEIELPAIQPGSSIMPGKVNPVIPEAVAQVAAQIIGNDATITVAGQSGNFQLNVMLPIIAYNILQSIEIAGNACNVLAEKAIDGFKINEHNISEKIAKNPILVTALNNIIGYELGAKIAKKAYTEKRAILDVAAEMTELSREELKSILNPHKLTDGGISDRI